MNIFVTCMALLFIFMCLVFIYAWLIEDNSIVDVAYGLAFCLITVTAILLFGTGHFRENLISSLIIIWGLRLAIHIFLRKRGEGEDFRYKKWREDWGETFRLRSFLQIFMLQGAIIFIVALPVQLVFHVPGKELTLFDLAGLGIWCLGFFFEAIGDWQLLHFKKNSTNKGKIIQHGLWRYTRHPNYFGEAVLWWGIFLIALNTPLGIWAIISPITIDFLLLKVSGIPMLEAKYQDNPEFEAYKARTNAFFPWFPKSGVFNG
ncbi:MAG: steroid 5-alpha reductase [Desulfuromonas sp.]|nr:MAG: steroid 5-alpha reductase [Desulfuromonas sp.]